MARIRSPNYPAVSLPEAIEKVRLIHTNDRQSPLDTSVIAQHLGYGGVNGLSLRLISALMRYGLLEEMNSGKAKVSPLAMRILFPMSVADRSAAIREAAFKPPLFAAMREEWPDGRPSDASLRSYLARRNFSEDAIPRVMEAYKATLEAATQDGADSSLVDNTQEAYGSDASPGQRGRNPPLGSPPSPQIPASGQGRSDRTAPGMSRATLPLSEGVAALELPDRLSAESLEDLRDWMEVMLRRAERVVRRTQQTGAASEEPDLN